MRRALGFILPVILMPVIALAQTGPQRPSPQQENEQEDVVRITTALVQTDVVVMDKNERIIPDLKLSDFELYENGKKQDIKFMEFISVNNGVNNERRAEGERPTALPPGAEIPHDLTAKELK